MLARLKSAISRRLHPKNDDLIRAQDFVKTDEVSGQTQFDLLIKSGLKPNSMLLEIGCGCLNAGQFLIHYLHAGHYVGVDPNVWLRTAAMSSGKVRRLVREKGPRFLSNDRFDASELNRTFDFIFSHSILSHAAHWQLEQFLQNTKKVLAPLGTILSSIRLADKDSMDAEWVYPGVSFFTLETVKSTAARCGLKAEVKPEYTEYYVQRRPAECHDWILFSAT